MRTIFICLLFCFSVSSFAQKKFSFGVNLDNNGAFVNIINHTSRYSNASSYDSLGWPESDFDLVVLDGRPVAEWNGTIDDPDKYRINYSGTYLGSFNGKANLILNGINVLLDKQSYDTATNTTFFELTVSGFGKSNHGLAFLNFSSTQSTSGSSMGTGITNLKINRPGYPINSTKTFTDEYIALCKAADFACYRYYTLQNIWDGEPVFPAKTTWDKRKTPLDASQTTMKGLNGKSDGWCWEYIIELANILNKDIWVNIHMSCDSNYVFELAKKLKTELNPSINIYVENSNEVWSPTQATHGPYNAAEALANGINFDQNYARRSVELSRWFAKEFGQNEINKRIRVILAGQQVYNGRSDIHLNYIKNTFGEPNTFIYANSTSLYIGSSNANSTDVLQINLGMTNEINEQIVNDQNNMYRLNHINKAKTWNLPGGCTSYEGGPHLPAGGNLSNLDNQILAHRAESMQQVIEQNYERGWKDIGGGLAMHFTLNSAYNQYGCWGLTDDYTKPFRNYKMTAVKNILARSASIASLSKNSALSVFPNPAKGEIYLTLDNIFGSHSVSIEIYNLQGKMVLNQKDIPLENQNLKIDISNLSSGLYILKAGSFSSKFVKN